jgi:hypothetical protein
MESKNTTTKTFEASFSQKDGTAKIKLTVTLSKEPPLTMSFDTEEAACRYLYHGLFGVTSPFITVLNHSTGQTIRGPVAKTVERARLGRMFEDFTGPGDTDD